MKPAVHIEWLVAFFALVSFQLSVAKDWSANDYPNPVIDFQKCGMKVLNLNLKKTNRGNLQNINIVKIRHEDRLFRI